MSPRPAARCYSPACASPPASRPWRMSRSTTARPWCANASPSTHPSPEPGPAHHRRRTPEPLSPPGPTCPDGQLLRRTPTHQRRRAATLLMQSTAALADETSQELGGSCANTRIRTSCRRPHLVGAARYDRSVQRRRSRWGELRNVLAGPPTISTRGNSTIPSGLGWVIGGCSSSAIPPAGHRLGASRTNSMISGRSAAAELPG
jgi:hypothetical protein